MSGKTRTRRPAPAPPVPAATVRGQASAKADLCALGRQYGGWRPGSREATICQETYGR
ncbi:hypothetical protein SHKM778_60960 [Streptomyces sp. KM77-8]|uniref:Integrase n=1 Tax=Streptomyces haneummycinicus TaxID=3074435 RepID=A0AAT9HQX9_9ACTN